MINEVWKDIPGYEGSYQVSNLGEVRSLPRFEKDKNGKVYKRKGVILKKTKTTTGYFKVELSKNNKKKSIRVHRLVAASFIVNTFDKPFINHKDGNALNNVLDNLEWCTQAENMKHAHDTCLIETIQNSVDHNNVIKTYLNNTKTNDVCKELGIPRSVLYRILKKHGIKRRKNSEYQDKYNLNLDNVLDDIKRGMRNVDIAKKYNCSREIINVRKYQFKKEGKI